MPRRASSSPSPFITLAIAAGIAVAAFAAKSFIGNSEDKAFKDVTSLSVEDFLNNGNSLRGNEYRIDGTVDEKLRWTPDRGQILSVLVDNSPQGTFVPIEIPSETSIGNIELRQKYAFKVRFRDGGIAVASFVKAL